MQFIYIYKSGNMQLTGTGTDLEKDGFGMKFSRGGWTNAEQN
jgi:hypothetical protein